MSSKNEAVSPKKEGSPAPAPRLRFPEFRNKCVWRVKKLNELLFETKARNRRLELGLADVLSVSGEYGCVNQIEFMGRSYAGVSVKDYHVVEHGDVVYTKSPLKKNPFGIIKENKGRRGIVSTLYAVYRPFPDCSATYLDHFFSRDYNLNAYLQPIVKKGAKNDMKVNNADVLKGDTLLNEWEMMREQNPAKKPSFDAIVANPPFSYRWDPSESMGDDVRFKNYGLAPRSAADFAFLLHGFHFLKEEGVMAIILPHGVLFRGGAEERIRTKLLKDGHIDTVIGLPANLFYSTGIPVCILVLKKCKKPDDVLFINAAEHFEKGKRQNQLKPEHIDKIIDTYQHRKEEPRYARRVEMAEIEKNDFNLNISRYISTATAEEEIDLAAIHAELTKIESTIQTATGKHNEFLKELGLPLLPTGNVGSTKA